MSSIKSVGHEFVECANELFTGKTFERFANLHENKQLEVVLKTAAVAFAVGILGFALFSSPVITFVAGGALALAYFTRDISEFREVFDTIDGVKKLVGKMNNAVNSLINS